jgi:hypothetical protein
MRGFVAALPNPKAGDQTMIPAKDKSLTPKTGQYGGNGAQKNGAAKAPLIRKM